MESISHHNTKRQLYIDPKLFNKYRDLFYVAPPKAIILGVQPYGAAPGERINTPLRQLMKQWSKDLGYPLPRWLDLRQWEAEGVYMRRETGKETTYLIRRCTNRNKELIVILPTKEVQVYAPFVGKGFDVRTEPPFFKRTDPVNWRVF